MSRTRRIEIACVVLSVATAGAIAVFAAPLPPLARYTESDVWTRGIEFVLVTFVLLALLSAASLVRARIGVGLDGLKVEPLADATTETRKDIEAIQAELRALQACTDRLVERLDAAGPGSPAEHDERIGAPEEPFRTLPSTSKGDSPEAPNV
jgi:hypothetical protein